MSKSILVIDKVERCFDCLFFGANLEKEICVLKELQNVAYKIRYKHAVERVPDWCPLKEMPEKMNSQDNLDDDAGLFCNGYNSCIDEILRERD